MAKSSLVQRTAGCGHAYIWYVFVKTIRPHCPACMPEVRRRIEAENRERADRVKAAISRTQVGYSIPITVRRAVYERDEWVCQLCFEPVDPDVRYPDPWSPSLDHIVCRSWVDNPDHSPSNLRLAHLWCNVVRGDERYHTADDLAPPPSMPYLT